MRPKAVVVLNMLFSGIPIEFHDGREYRLSEDNDIAVKGQKEVYDGGTGPIHKECFLKTDMSFRAFVNLADSLSDEDISIMVANKIVADYRGR